MTHSVTQAKAQDLVHLFNAYTIVEQPQREIHVPNASRLAAMQEVSVDGGVVLPKMIATKKVGTAKPDLRPPAGKNKGYGLEGDGDLHLQVGVVTGSMKGAGHVGCEIQKAKGLLADFQAQVGKPISVDGFFRCLFEHPGFGGKADAHIFEVHPVRFVDPLHGARHTFDVDVPEPQSVHSWKGQGKGAMDANVVDAAMKVRYDPPTDTLVFTGMRTGIPPLDKNYVQVKGTIASVKATTLDEISTLRFSSPDIARSPMDVICLPRTRAKTQLATLSKQGTTTVWLVALRNIDLAAATGTPPTYRINLLAIDVADGAKGPVVPPKDMCAACQGKATRGSKA